MRNLAFAAAAAAVLLVTACSDTTSPEARGPASESRIIAPSGTLDQNINSLLGLYPKGLATAGRNRWGNVKAKYQAGLTKPSEMKVAQKMLRELVEWVQDKAPELNQPPNNETREAAAARLTLYMAMYVYEGPASVPPAFIPGADNAVGFVSPSDSVTIVTPSENAGVFIDEGSVAEETIVVITENPTPYPANCTGPLATRICQYPKFYHFSQFPHVRLSKPAKFAVCHVNHGDERTPLADHDRFRLAHTKPADPDDYTPGSTIRDQDGESIEILPLITQTFSPCEHVHYALNPPTGMTGVLARLASNIGKLITPENAWAIDQGGGGSSVMFSDFNNVDPDGVPETAVSLATSYDTVHALDHVTVTYTMSNSGTASSPAVPATIRFNYTGGTAGPYSVVLATVPVPAVHPGQTTTIATEVVIPDSVTPGAAYTLSVEVAEDPGFPDADMSNNSASMAVPIAPSFLSIARDWNVGESSVCALRFSAVSCWGSNEFWEHGAAGPEQSTPYQSTPLQLGFVEMSRGPTPQFYCGIKADRSAACWGRNGWGQLGRGTAYPSPASPAVVSGGISWREITTGRLSACGVSTSGAGYCWGSNQLGEIGRASVPLGIDSASMTFSPALVDGGLTWKSVVAGWLHACGITTSGAAYCWGDNQRGQLGIGTIDSDSSHRSPAPVMGGLQFIQLSLGGTYSCGVTTDHKLYCWGENFTSQVGNGGSGPSADVGTPVQIGGSTRFSYVSAGSGFAVGGAVAPPAGSGQAGAGHTCALTEKGEAWCWGWNAAGQLGNGSLLDSGVPVAVSTTLRFTSLSLGGTATCGRKGSEIWCWGGNEFGQLGIGSLTNTSTPTLVNFAPIIY